MKTICITGFSEASLIGIRNIFEQSGMAPARPTQTSPPMDIATWHGQFLASAAQDDDQTGDSPSSPGRLWERLAVDLFLANMDATVWGWALPDSIRLLDFWLRFEPKLYFILVCVSPEQAIMDSLQAQDANPGDTESTFSDPSSVLNAWNNCHQLMLRFHLRHPDRSLLVDAADCDMHQQALVSTCGDKWGLPLTFTEQARPAAKPDDLSMYLAGQLCRTAPWLNSLQHELESALHRFGPAQDSHTPSQEVTAEVISSYQETKRQSVQLLQVQEELARISAQHQKIASRLENAEKINEALQTQAEAAKTQIQKIQDERKEAVQENELLLTQLHQVQEELEHYFLKHQDVKNQHQDTERRWQRMLVRNPSYIDYESIEMHSVPASQSGAPALTFQAKNLSAAGRVFPVIAWEVFVADDMAGFVFRDNAEMPSPLVRWPSSSATNELVLHPDSEADPGRNALYADLAVSDMDLLFSLASVTGEALKNPDTRTLPPDFPSAAMADALERFSGKLRSLPPVLRYDAVTLTRAQVNPDYEHLWLTLENVGFADFRWPRFAFRVSCANVGPHRFGTHPKLEFPEGPGQVPFDSWFEEGFDDFGPKLELRFALPEAMDVEVWRKLSGNDQQFVGALIERLPGLLENLRPPLGQNLGQTLGQTLGQADVQIKRPWEDWQALVVSIQSIFAALTHVPAPPHPPRTDVPDLAVTSPGESDSRGPSRTPKPLLKVKV